jgi:hypothetical protein
LHEVDSVYNEYEKDLNKHAPIKSRYQRKKPLPCMNQELRRAVYRKQMLYSQFTKCQSNISLLSEFFPIFVALTFCKLRI